MSLAVKLMYLSPVKFVLINLHYILNWWYSLGRNKDNGYCFICYTQENIIFCSTYTIFDKKLFPKYTNSHIKEHKLYDKLLDKISPETELSASSPSKKDRPTLIPILHISIPLIQNNLPTYSPLPSLSYKPPSLTSATESKKPTI